MKKWSDMTYDEQRNALGLANVKYAVLGGHVARAGRRMIEAFRQFNELCKPVLQQSDYALAGSKEAK